MAEEGEFWVEIKESAIEENTYLRRFLEWPDGEADQEISYSSEEAAKLDVHRINLIGDGKIRLQPGEHYEGKHDAILVSTGESTGGYGRTTRNATSGWQYKRKQAIERDNFQCQKCGIHGGPDGSVELHVNHVVPKSEGGSDDLSNLQTLCRECHMHLHEFPTSRESASIDVLIEKIDSLSRNTPIPAFTHSGLYSWLTNEVDLAVDHDALREAMSTLVRFGRFSKMELDSMLQYNIPGDVTEYRGRGQIEVFYVESAIDKSKLKIYDSEVEYDGDSVDYENPPENQEYQSGLEDF